MGIILIEVVLIIINNYYIKKTREEIGKYTSNRISVIHDIIESLRVIKFYAWE